MRSFAAALAVTIIAGWGPGPAAAAPIDYTLTIPLVDIVAADLIPTALFSGVVTYDDERSSGTGTFSLSRLGEPASASFAGDAWVLSLGDGFTGVLFDGTTSDDARLFFNIAAGSAANAFVSRSVSYCTTGCAFFQSVGATITPAGLATGPGAGDDTGPVVSPVPLPPAAALFGAALLGLGLLGAGRRLAPARQRVRRARPGASGTARTTR